MEIQSDGLIGINRMHPKTKEAQNEKSNTRHQILGSMAGDRIHNHPCHDGDNTFIMWQRNSISH